MEPLSGLLRWPSILGAAAFKQSSRYKSLVPIVRRALPKYKKDLRDLPPLTKFLVHDRRTENSTNCDNQEPTSLEDLWAKKLEILRAYLPIDSKPVLLEALFKPTDDVGSSLTIIGDNLPSMTSFYIATCFEILHDHVLYHDHKRHTILVSPEFRSLCHRSLFKMRYFEADEVLKVMKCLSILRLPEHSLIVQSALQMAQIGRAHV